MSSERRARGYTVDIPPAREECPSSWYIAVRGDVVERMIDVLRCYIAQWRPPEGIEPTYQAANSLIVATCSVLADLMEAHAARNRLHGAPELLDQIEDFVSLPFTHGDLEALGEQPEFIDALLALARKERAP
jgi:hypothetical protein